MTEQSYLSRCEHWLDTEDDLTAEGLEGVIENFACRLRKAGSDNQVLVSDLQATLTLLNSNLNELRGDTEKTGEDEPVDTLPLQLATPPQRADTLPDFGPLIPDATPLNLSAAEKQARLQRIIQSGKVCRGSIHYY